MLDLPSHVVKNRTAQVFEHLSERLHRLNCSELPSLSMQSSWAPRTENQGVPWSNILNNKYGDLSMPFR